MEKWKPIPSAPDYAVSDKGNIKRIAPYARNRDYGGPSIRTAHHGYMYTQFRINGKRKNMFIHRCVMEAFVGPSDLQVNHKNGDRQDNRLENLEYVTPKENQRHSKEVLNSFQMGSRHHNSKLTEKDILEIFLLAKSGLPKEQIGRMYGVTGTNIGYILKRKGWNQVDIPDDLL